MARMVARQGRKRGSAGGVSVWVQPYRGWGLAPLLLLLCGLIMGCNGDEPANPAPPTTADREAPAKESFPASSGRSLDQVIREADPPSNTDPVITPASQVFYPGENRYSFTLAERDHQEITDAEVALYIAPIPDPGQGRSAYDEPALGPFPARVVSLGTEPEYRSDTTAENPFASTAFYVTDIPFSHAGDWRVEALIRHQDRLIAKSLPRAAVGAYRGIPRRGDRPPQITTPTPTSSDAGAQGLTTRRPPGSLNDLNFAEVLGERPVALLFTSPAFCQSRACSPVADVAEQVNAELGGEVEVIHMEIYNDNDPDHGVRPQVRRFNLPSDTWLFVAGADGRIRTAVEGPFGVDEMKGWLEEAGSE